MPAKRPSENVSKSELRNVSQSFAAEFVDLQHEIENHIDGTKDHKPYEENVDHLQTMARRTTSGVEVGLDGKLENPKEKANTLALSLDRLQDYATRGALVEKQLAETLFKRLKTETRQMPDIAATEVIAKAFLMVFGPHIADDMLAIASGRPTVLGIGKKRNETLTNWAREKADDLTKPQPVDISTNIETPDLPVADTAPAQPDSIAQDTPDLQPNNTPEAPTDTAPESVPESIDTNDLDTLFTNAETSIQGHLDLKTTEGLEAAQKEYQALISTLRQKNAFPLSAELQKRYDTIKENITALYKELQNPTEPEVPEKTEEQIEVERDKSLLQDLTARILRATKDKKINWENKDTPFSIDAKGLYVETVDHGNWFQRSRFDTQLVIKATDIPEGMTMQDVLNVLKDNIALVHATTTGGENFETTHQKFEKQKEIVTATMRQITGYMEDHMFPDQIDWDNPKGTFGIVDGDIVVYPLDGSEPDVVLRKEDIPPYIDAVDIVVQLELNKEFIKAEMENEETDVELTPEEQALIATGLTAEEAEVVIESQRTLLSKIGIHARIGGRLFAKIGGENPGRFTRIMGGLAGIDQAGKFGKYGLSKFGWLGRGLGLVTGIDRATDYGTNAMIIEGTKGVVRFTPFAGPALDMIEGIQALFTGKRMGTDIPMSRGEAWTDIGLGAAFMVVDIFTLGAGSPVRQALKQPFRWAKRGIGRGINTLGSKLPGGIGRWFSRRAEKQGVEIAQEKAIKASAKLKKLKEQKATQAKLKKAQETADKATKELEEATRIARESQKASQEALKGQVKKVTERGKQVAQAAKEKGTAMIAKAKESSTWAKIKGWFGKKE